MASVPNGSSSTFTPPNEAQHHTTSIPHPRERITQATSLLQNGGIVPPSQTPPTSRDETTLTTLSLYEKQYFPSQPKSLSGIAIRSLLLGVVLTLSTTLSLSIFLTTTSPFWRAPFFLATLSLFHFLEFWTTARYNTQAAQISSFLLSQNGSAYNIAHTGALLEFLVVNWFFPSRQWFPPTFNTISLILGLAFIMLGQAIRTFAMIEAGTSFNHIVQHSKKREHRLITTGVYSLLRHPSYFGFFWWGLGTQLVLGNVGCFVGYTVVLWRFFSRRIEGEEELLVRFFGEEYVEYRARKRVGIPFID